MAAMIPEKDMPEGCRTCRFFKKHTPGLSLDYSYSCMHGAKNFPMPWIKQEIERADDCPLKPIEGLIEKIMNTADEAFDGAVIDAIQYETIEKTIEIIKEYCEVKDNE